MIVWRDSYSIDGGVIDADHKALIAMVNEFATLSGGTASLARLKSCLAGLRKYTIEHFAREETVMRNVGFPNIDRHKAAHREIVSVLGGIIADFRTKVNRSDNDHNDVRERIQTLLKTWLINHVFSVDLELRPYVEAYRAAPLRAVAEGNDDDRADGARA